VAFEAAPTVNQLLDGEERMVAISIRDQPIKLKALESQKG
jgi:hypothetical protein